MGICPLVGENTGKLVLIPNNLYGGKGTSIYKFSLMDEPKQD